jgi:hypothetical protein
VPQVRLAASIVAVLILHLEQQQQQHNTAWRQVDRITWGLQMATLQSTTMHHNWSHTHTSAWMPTATG